MPRPISVGDWYPNPQGGLSRTMYFENGMSIVVDLPPQRVYELEANDAQASEAPEAQELAQPGAHAQPATDPS